MEYVRIVDPENNKICLKREVISSCIKSQEVYITGVRGMRNSIDGRAFGSTGSL